MMSMIWVVLFLALTGSHCGYGLPVRPTPQDYPLDGSSTFSGWGAEGGVYAAIPVLALVVTAIVLLFGCTWCYRHKDCKPNEGTDNQLFTASAQHLQAAARVVPPDSGFSEPANNNISEDNNNGPISLREMQNIANNNAAAYIVSENEERNRISRESVVEFEPLPTGIVGVDPLERCADWFGGEDFPRNNLQYLREIGRGWFGRVVEGEIEEAGASTTVAVKILNQNATLEDKARFLDEAKIYRDVTHENILAFIGKCLHEDPWILMFELCPMNLQQYLIVNRPKMAILNENGVPLQLMCDISSALSYLHSRGYTYGRLWSGSVLMREPEGETRAVLGRYTDSEPQHDYFAPETRQGALYTASSEIWSLGTLIWEVCSWGAAPSGRPSPPPDLPCPYKSHLYQVMQLCWNDEASARPTAGQVHALISHLHATHAAERAQPQDHAHFEARWQRLKPNTIPKIDEHVAIVHAPSTARFAGDELEHGALSVHASAAVSRSSSIMSDREPLASNVKSESLTNLHGSLDDVRNIYLTHNETAALECHQGNMQLEDEREKEQDRSDASMDPWLKEIIAGSQDDVSYYKDVSDVIKNLDNILNSEKTSSSESSHQASPSRDNLSLDCKKEYPLQSSLVKSPGITNFQNVIDTGFAVDMEEGEPCVEEEVDRDTIGTLSHSFERHSDTTSQHTLENLTPDTPMRDIQVFVDVERLATEAEISEIESQIKSVEIETESETIVDIIETETTKSVERDDGMPKEVDSNVPELRELCIASMPSVSDNEQSPSKDCKTPCDNVTEIRTEDETKSVDDVREAATDSMPLEVVEVTDSVENIEREETSIQRVILPTSADETTINEGLDTLPSVTEDVSTTQENDTSLVRLEDIGPESIESENNYSKDETILVSDLVDTITDSSKDEQLINRDGIKIDVEVDIEPVPQEQTPVSVQNIIKHTPSQEPDLKQAIKADSASVKLLEVTPTHLPPEIVQNTDRDAAVQETEELVRKEVVETIEKLDNKNSDASNAPRSDSLVDIQERTDDSSPHKDLINDTNSQILTDSTVDNSVKQVEVKDNSGVETAPVDDSALSKNESTQYLDLPSFDMIKKTSDFLQMERIIAANSVESKLVSSTPIGSDKSGDLLDSFGHGNEDETNITCKANMPLYESATAEQKCFDIMSPFESPSHKSHQTDTYDENSSVVLGPFENCATDIFKGSKPNIDPVELPREELLAFSSNFSEMNLETPSPLRDGNFLNEVPDIAPDGLLFDDLASISEPKVDIEAPSDDSELCSAGTQKRVSPSTPPNSPGVSLAGTSQEKYLVDIDLNAEAPEPDSSIRSIDLNQIELQITSKLAMAENENNLNIEYSGPLTVEGLIEEGGAMRESDAVPELYLAGNGGSAEDVRELLSLNEECVQALRNELELKLPLAQVAGIEPASEAEGEWGAGAELPPPPELVVSYLGALSPIQEETAPQLSAYENDTHWNPSTRTESSESYPEPCNNSTESATSLPRADTYTVSRDPPAQHAVSHDVPHAAPHDAPHAASSREITMSMDSLNDSGSSHESRAELSPQSPVDERTYKCDERTYTIEEERCERISQVSPFLVSPTADTDTGDEATRVSTLSRTTLPTDAKHSKPSDTQGLSKATSIDSWCSNDTLYNVEENFDEVAVDAEPNEVNDGEPTSASTDTLTHDDEPSHCSTYLVHDGASERADSFSPDSIAPDPRHTYTKVKLETAATPSADTDLDDSRNTHTKDLAYGTLMSGMPSYSTCSTEAAAGLEEAWRPRQPELMRRSPQGECDISPPRCTDEKECEENPPPLSDEHRLSRMDSVDITCLRDRSVDSPAGTDANKQNVPANYYHVGPTQTSTPLVDPLVDLGHDEEIALNIAEFYAENSGISTNGEILQEFNEAIPQNFDSKATPSEELLEGLSKTSSQYKGNSLGYSEGSLNYSEFENSVACKPQGKIELERTPTYSDFENSAAFKPQDKSEPNHCFSESKTSTAGESQENVVSGNRINNSEIATSTACNPPVEVESDHRPADSEVVHTVTCKSQDMVVFELSPTYSEFENSAMCKPQGKAVLERSPTYSEFENSAMCKPQDKAIPEHSTTYSEFEHSATAKPQDKTITERSTTYSDFENSAAFKPQENAVLECSPTSSELLNVAVCESQTDKQSSDKSSQSMESGFSSEEFRSFENSVKGRPQDLNSLIDASSLLLNSERMFSDLAMNPIASTHNQNSSRPSSNVGAVQPVVISPPSITNLIESHELVDTREPSSAFLINFDLEDETEQPHSIIVTEVPMTSTRISPNRINDSHMEANLLDTFNSHLNRSKVFENSQLDFGLPRMNGEAHEQPESLLLIEQKSPIIENQSITNHTLADDEIVNSQSNDVSIDKLESRKDSPNGSTDAPGAVQNVPSEVHLNGGSEKFATVNFLNETFEELVESSVDDSDSKDDKLIIDESAVPNIPDSEEQVANPVENKQESSKDSLPSTTESQEQSKPNGAPETEGKITTVTEDFLKNEKKYATLDSYFPLLTDIRFTGPASEMMSTSFQDSPTSPNSPECEQDSKPSAAADILKEWDSDSESHSSNSSSGEFIWKDGDGHETSVVPSTHFDHQRGSSGGGGGAAGDTGAGAGTGGDSADSGSGSGSGSEGDEVEFVPSSWDCRAAPAKSSLRSLEQATPESKKRVVFKRQKYHCVYEYPREAADAQHSPAYLPDLSTYCEWDPTSAEEAELCYGQLFSSPAALGVGYPLRAGGGGPFGTDYDEDFFISSSARPFESLGIMSTTSQFFPGGMHGKRALLERSLSDEGFPAPPTPTPAPATPTAPDLDFTTPDSGVEDITPGSTLELDFEPKKGEPEAAWRPLDSGSSSESVSPSSPGGELGGLRHTRDRLKLDLPPSPHAPSPRHARVFNFALAAPKRRGDTPLVMTDDTPVAGGALPLPADDVPPAPPPEPTFSTFGKSAPRHEPEQKIILTDELAAEPEPEPEGAPETAAKGEGTVLDSGDEDSGIESSSKATLERSAPDVS